ncbi:hypothetical protein E2C01_093017 [Portunus trituberculatus]|uniref:Uncharacterized protein n=1 Tax=Portunus trituberculatus TaxID=210409 RepID=A0A5B7JHZ2_PORTR|nr:hypothetical protein [Portunus trituberculatus]
MEGYHNLTIAATAENKNFPETFLHLGVDSVSAAGNKVTVETPDGQSLFMATKDDILVGADRLTVTGE